MLAMITAAVLAAPTIDLGERHALVGVLTEQGHLECKGGDGPPWGGGEEVWRDLYPEVGFVRLVPPAGFETAALNGELVIALGKPADGPTPARPSGCNAMQMRSDWVYGKSGMRVKRTRPPHVAFVANAVQPTAMLTAERVSQPRGPVTDTLKIRLTNPFDRPLSGLVLTLHHEGCYGKPGATAETARRATLAPGETWTADLPAFVSQRQGRGHWHAAAAITLDATAEHVAFDLDVPVRRLGVEVKCAETDLAPQDSQATPPLKQMPVQKKTR